MDYFEPVTDPSNGGILQEGTLNGNPVAAVAGLATLRVLRREGTYERLFATGNVIKDSLLRMLNEAEIPAKVVGRRQSSTIFYRGRH